jgi:1,4-alpha-glucan branching enzyme
MLLAPSPPMLFMGEEFGATTPFLFFCDYGGGLATAVTTGRRDEFGRFERFRDPMVRAAIPDPNAQSTFEASKLDWTAIETDAGRAWTAFYRECIGARHRLIVPRRAETMHGGSFRVHRDALLSVRWMLGDGSGLDLVANFSPEALGDERERSAQRVYATHADAGRQMPAYAVAVYIE